MIGTLTVAAATPLAALAGLTYATIAPRCAFWGPVISRGDADSGKVALTFDDGPTPGATDQVLDALDRLGVKATFFVIGVNAERHPDLIGRIHDEGHLIANHTYRHSHYAIMHRRAYWEQEIAATDAVIQSITGVRPTIFRPPLGFRTWHVMAAARRRGHRVVNWSHRALDGVPTTQRRIMDRFSAASAGDILLLHDGVEPEARHTDRSATIAAVPTLVRRLGDRGLTPVRLDALINCGPRERNERDNLPAQTPPPP